MKAHYLSLCFVTGTAFVSTSALAICDFGTDTCKPGFVWREAFPGDHVCVTGETRSQAAADNNLVSERRSPTGGDFGPETCKMGFVWREAVPSDRVCVTGATRDATRTDNAQGENRRDPQCVLSSLSNIHVEFEQPSSGEPPSKPSVARTKITSDGSLIGITQGPLAGVPDRMWNPGETIKVHMTGGTPKVRSKVRQFAEEWTKYANIHLQFVDTPSLGTIRVAFMKGKGSWSVVGRDPVLFMKVSPHNPNPITTPTMNFGWFDDDTDEDEIRRTTLHEFGHALGLIHEHSSPTAGIAWDKEKVYQYYKETQDPPWDRNDVDRNVFKKYSVLSTNYSQYDPTSIMHYRIPPELTLDGKETPKNWVLSAIDKRYIAKWYPFPGADTGQLRTNDDCDQIDFRVEYGVEEKDWIGVNFKSGSTVTSWKAIKIPFAENQYSQIEIQNGSSYSGSFYKDKLDSSRPIRFAKAKFLGIPTLLGYTWDVMPALPGGSRVTLTWVNDRCR